jgi:hypothetical protein
MSKPIMTSEIMFHENKELRKRCDALASQVRSEKERADNHQAKLAQMETEQSRFLKEDHVQTISNSFGSFKLELQEAMELILVAGDRSDRYHASTSKLANDYLHAVDVISQLQCKVKAAENNQCTMETETEMLRARICDTSSQLDAALRGIAELRGQEQKHQEEARRTREQSDALKVQLEEERARNLRLEQDLRKRRAEQVLDRHE